jgi:hypothetical protein
MNKIEKAQKARNEFIKSVEDRMKDPEYEMARNKLIPFAERYTDEKIGKKPTVGRDTWAADWTAEFIRKMNTLAIEHKVVSRRAA